MLLNCHALDNLRFAREISTQPGMEQEPDETPFIMKSNPSENRETMDALSLPEEVRWRGKGRGPGGKDRGLLCLCLAHHI